MISVMMIFIPLLLLIIFISIIFNNMDQTNIKSTPKDVFLHLFNILTFYLSTIGFITVCIQYINVLFPDLLNFYFEGIASAVRVATAMLVVSLPAYLYTSFILAKDLVVNPEKRDLKLRKWLLYFTLFISAVTIIVDLITFIFNFLNGELTTQFFFKILVVLLVAGAVFGYYTWELKRTNAPTKTPKLLAAVVSVVVLALVVAGFFIIGTPTEQRNRRFDDQRVQSLQMIQNQIVYQWTQKKMLPVALIDLQDSISGFVVPTDPSTKVQYEYTVVEPLKFQLCATFQTDSNKYGVSNVDRNYSMPYGSQQETWSHKAERTCFDRTIDPQLYKTDTTGNMVVPKPIQ